MQAQDLYPFGAYAAGLLLTLPLAAWLTPRRWWRRPTARALLILGLGAWAFGSLLLAIFPPPAPPPLPSPLAQADPAPLAGQPYRAHHDLNLRAGAGVDAPRIGVVPAGATVTPTGVRSGDWWQVKASVGGRDNTGWASSLWLRRITESAPPP
ncbi:SH3 domain-containing protein [Janthinobacterium sp.]|uniref:SH3 domain-containing protein n=1 Tax=Janthinobacterium sp. TaxID=1871054 RepID=UPI00293D8D59|nr:SH3 domain-containing protein [Janthinobacterium sp.]